MPGEFVTVGSFDEPCKAHIAQAKLDAAGIKCFLSGENFVATYWLLSRVEGGIKLKVARSDAETALEILRKKEEPSGVKEMSEFSQYDLVCPACGSENIEYEHYSRKMALFSILLLRLPLSWPKKQYRCFDCGHTWK